MKVGDLVRYDSKDWADWVGIVIRQIPGTDQRQVVQWTKGIQTTNPRRNSEVISESR